MRYEILIAVRPAEGITTDSTEWTPLGHADSLDDARTVAAALTDYSDAAGCCWEMFGLEHDDSDDAERWV